MTPSVRSIHSHRVPTLAFIGLATAAVLAACGGGSSSSTAAPGTVSMQLTDSPACGYDHVYVTVDHAEISSDGSNWTTVPVNASVGRIDLLNLHNGALVSLGQAPLSAGTYQQVRLVLEGNGNAAPWANALVLTGASTETPLKTPSAQQSGYKINGPFTVQSGSMADLILDFDACKSIIVAGASGQYLLKPVVRAIAQVASGSISGTTAPDSLVYAEQQSGDGPIIVTGAVADSGTGAFILSPVLESSTGGTVDVVIVPPATNNHGAYIVQNVPVSAGAATSIGTITASGASLTYTVSGTVTVSGMPGAANLVADQTVTGTGRSYEIASTATTTGAYSIALAAPGPWLGNYNATLPIALVQDTAMTDAGAYSIIATDAAGTSSAVSANLSTGPLLLNFVLTP